MKKFILGILITLALFISYSYTRTSDSVYLEGIEDKSLTSLCRGVESLTGSRVYSQLVSVINDDTSKTAAAVLQGDKGLDNDDVIIRINQYTGEVNIFYYSNLEDNLDRDSVDAYVAKNMLPLVEDRCYVDAIKSTVIMLIPVLLVNRLVPNGWVFRVGALMCFLILSFMVVCVIQLFYSGAQGTVTTFISECIRNGMTYEEILSALQSQFDLTEEDAQVFIDDYKVATDDE